MATARTFTLSSERPPLVCASHPDRLATGRTITVVTKTPRGLPPQTISRPCCAECSAVVVATAPKTRKPTVRTKP